jgi:threonine aldolase
LTVEAEKCKIIKKNGSEGIMYLFHNDYNQMCHPAILERMQDIAAKQMDGYSEDTCCQAAAEKIRGLCGREDIAVHFLVGGTQSNLIVIAASLRPHQAVIGANTAHINVHETGAIEATGHKVLSLDSKDGKIRPEQIRNAVDLHWIDAAHEHIAQPKMVYISNSTELGTAYTLAELEAISAVCREKGLYLFVDGARLGYAMAAEGNDVTYADLARLCDVFYIGGTKVGAMIGEAVVITNPAIAEDFRYIIKQRGAMLAKGWLLGVQFDVLMEDNLYLKIAHRANILADRIRETLHVKGYPIVAEDRTNQIFAIMPDVALEVLKKDFTFSIQERCDDNHTMVRFCTSWGTTEESVKLLCEAIEKL